MKPSVKSPVAFSPEGKRLLVLRPVEANILVFHGYGEWRGRVKGAAVTSLVCKSALLLFIGQMRYRDRDKTTALDSRTHSSDGTVNPWKNVRHVRNDAYADHFSVRLNMPIRQS